MLLLTKLLLAPTLVALASLAGRRWGPTVGGWLAGFPIVAGPVLFFYTWEQGPAFAARAALSTLTGLGSLTLFALAYARAARTRPWPFALAAGWSAFALGTLLLRPFDPTLSVAAGFGALSLAGGLLLLPRGGDQAASTPPGRWDLPLRMGATAAIVLTLTALAEALGPALSGLLTPFPVATTVLVVFTHRSQGAAGALKILRGLLGALYGFIGFLTVLAAGLERWGAAPTFVGALALAGLIHLFSLRFLRNKSDPAGADRTGGAQGLTS